MRALTVTVVSSLVVLLAACGGGQPTATTPAGASSSSAAPAAPAGSAASAVVAPGEAKVGDKSFCLISKEEFVVKADSPKAEYEGKTYYFCCPGCDSKFKADPKKYLGK